MRKIHAFQLIPLLLALALGSHACRPYSLQTDRHSNLLPASMGESFEISLENWVLDFKGGAAQDRRIMNTYDNIPYIVYPDTPAKLTSLDIYAPEGAQRSPVIVYIHGGGWTSGDKKLRMRHKPPLFTTEGFIFVSANYRLAPRVIFPAYAEDVASAIAWVTRNISRYGGDPERIFLLGHSAGAHLAALVAVDGSYLEKQDLSLETIKGTILIEGFGYDIPSLLENGGWFVKRIFTKAFGNEEIIWEIASPISHVDTGLDLSPFLLIWAGSLESSQDQTMSLFTALNQGSYPVQVFHIPDKNHSSVNRDIGKPGDKTTRVIMDFLEELTLR